MFGAAVSNPFFDCLLKTSCSPRSEPKVDFCAHVRGSKRETTRATNRRAKHHARNQTGDQMGDQMGFGPQSGPPFDLPCRVEIE